MQHDDPQVVVHEFVMADNPQYPIVLPDRPVEVVRTTVEVLERGNSVRLDKLLMTHYVRMD